jgi:hypothetical protein
MSDAPGAAAPSAPAAPLAPTDPSNAMPGGDEIEGLSPEDLAAEIKAEEKAAEVKNMKKKYQLKVNNKMRDIELDLGNDEEVQKYLQKAMGADERFQEAATVRKQMEQLINELKTNPMAILKHKALGLDVRKLAEQVMNEEIEELSLTEEQKKIRQLEASLKEREDRDKTREEELQQARREQLEQAAADELDKGISDALNASNLPKSPYVVKRVTDAMITAIELGYKNVTVDQVMPFVEEQMMGELQRLFEEAPEDTADKLLERFVGKKSLDRYRSNKVKKARAKAPTETASKIVDSGKKVEATTKDKNKAEEKKVRFKDMFGTF